MNLMMLLEMASGGFAERTAIGSLGTGLTYDQLFHRAGATAARFREAGIDRVSMVDTSSEALPIALFGSAWAGVPFVPLNYRLTGAELRNLAAEVAPSVTVCNPDALTTIGDVEGVRAVARPDFLTQWAGTGGDSGDSDWGNDPDEIAILLYTSGTTGAPKAAVLRHKHLVSYIIGSVEFMGATEDEATLVSVPPYHVAGIAAILSSVYAGRRIVQLPNFDPAGWVNLVRTENVTHAMVVPTMLARIVEHLEKVGGGLPSLRALSYGGGRMPAPVIYRALDLLPSTNFVNAYGLTETSSTVAVLGPDEHREAHASDDPAVRARLGSAGRPLPAIEVTIRDDEGNPVAPGTSGEIWVRGEQVSGEYLGRDSRVTPEGWFPTSDGGSMDAGGYLYVEGRMDDIIVRGGENISPGEIEDVLLSHPSVVDAAAVGVPDEQWGEAVAAVVVPATGQTVDIAELQNFVKTRMRSSRTPDRIELRDELPYNETGKLLRRILRDELTGT
ncbi:class I adenylate-forming enzyme family protein [Candidatus Poriferisocius sp.]|uniref:class I adenylate-forming enzyme family protein n=1 Tax=Candidatus Poriferisocius sp. TaxID=3101276 RepID=UPI003B02DA26